MANDDNRCLADLLLTDPRDDKTRIEQTKGGLLNDSFRWILDNPEFQRWCLSEQSQLLWIKGDAGKGKTMLMIGIIDELSQQPEQSAAPGILSHFLCQGTDTRLNNATAVLRGLIYLLVIQQPLLISHLREKYDHYGRKLFEDSSAFDSLSEIFRQMLQDPRLSATYLAVDALDECEVGLPQLLDLITQTGSVQSTRVKWIVSSRYTLDIEQRLRLDDSGTRLSLELSAEHISPAINMYVNHQVSQLASLRHDRALQEKVCDRLCRKSDGTFLWVALVIEALQNVLEVDILKVLEEFPSGLTPLYDQMMKRIEALQHRYPQCCLVILSTAILAYRPLHMHEIHVAAGLQEEIPRLADLQRLIDMCGSFLTICDDYVYFIHQSAKDYLTTNAYVKIFPAGPGPIHHKICLQSLHALSKTLRKDIYNLKYPGPLTEKIIPDPDPLVSVRYSCVFWIDHLCEIDGQGTDLSTGLSDGGAIFVFFKQHFLHWLESLSLICKLSDGVPSIRKLLNRVQVCQILPTISSGY
jgi:NACHT domain